MLKVKESLTRIVNSFISQDNLSLLFVAAIETVIIIVRFMHFHFTGFMLPDEAYYYWQFIIEKNISLHYRPFFAILYTVFFRGVNNIRSFLWVGMIWSIIWAIGTLIVVYKILRSIEIPVNTRSMIILTTPLFVIFTVMAPLVLTETVGLFFAFVGMYFCITYLKTFKARYAFLSALAYVLAYKIREPYILFAIGNLMFIIIFLRRTNWRKRISGVLAYIISLIPVVPIPTSVSSGTIGFIDPLTTQPVMNLVFTASLFDMLKGVLFSFVVGYGPLLAVVAFTSLIIGVKYLIYKKCDVINEFVIYNMVLGMMSTVISIAFAMSSAGWQWIGVIIRTSHTSLLSVLGLHMLYDRLTLRRFIMLMLSVITLSSIMFPFYGVTLQSSLNPNQPVNRIFFSYRAPYYRLNLLAKDSGETLVIGGLHMRYAKAFLHELNNVDLIAIPVTEDEFKQHISQDWDTILLYDDYYTLNSKFQTLYPEYYWDLMHSESYDDFIVETMWIDSESYCLRLRRA